VNVASTTQTVVLQLVVMDQAFDSYRASVQTAEGSDLAIVGNIKPSIQNDGTYVELRLPAQLLQPRNYQIKLTALTSAGTYEDVAVYPFQVVKM
jgi:hypothetical protein